MSSRKTKDLSRARDYNLQKANKEAKKRKAQERKEQRRNYNRLKKELGHGFSQKWSKILDDTTKGKETGYIDITRHAIDQYLKRYTTTTEEGAKFFLKYIGRNITEFVWSPKDDENRKVFKTDRGRMVVVDYYQTENRIVVVTIYDEVETRQDADPDSIYGLQAHPKGKK